jgi:hypothetical protein
MYATGTVKLSHKTILHALPTFITLITLALTANILYKQFGDPSQTFNMFFISPYYACTLPILSIINEKVPYLVFLACYVLGFTAAGYVTSLLPMVAVKVSASVHTASRNKNIKYS